MTCSAEWQDKRAALIIAHPGHELRVHRWVELAQPGTLVLTDGSGRKAESRLASTTKVLQAASAQPGPVFGRFTDAAFYEAMLSGDSKIFLNLMDEIARWLIAEQVDYVVADALEGYNTSHDICRYIVGAACETAGRSTGRTISNYDFLLTGRPGEFSSISQAEAIIIDLDDKALKRKIRAAKGYSELKEEVDFTLCEYGACSFAKEYLRPAHNRQGLGAVATAIPYYEVYGEKQKAAGYYQHVIRHREHLLPIVEALWARLDGH